MSEDLEPGVIDAPKVRIDQWRNPVWSRADHSIVDFEAHYVDKDEWHPYSARAGSDDPEEAGLWDQIMAAGNIGAYVPPPVEPVVYQISKTTPWLRMTEDEAATMDAVMSETGARLKQIYMAATYLASNDPLWATLHEMLANAFGAARADQLLAPET